jgi:hypothetical protein
MLEMCRELGFALRQERSDPGIVNVTLDLAPQPSRADA